MLKTDVLQNALDFAVEAERELYYKMEWSLFKRNFEMRHIDRVDSDTRNNTWSRSNSGFTGDRLSDDTQVFKLAEIPEKEAAYKTPNGRGLSTFHHSRKLPFLASSSSSYCTKKGRLFAR